MGLARTYYCRSIWGSKALVKEKVLWRVGNGTTINKLDEPWILNDERWFMNSERVNGLNYVCDLIDYRMMK